MIFRQGDSSKRRPFKPLTRRGAGMRMRLIVVAGPDQGQVFDLLQGQPLVIGRGQDTNTRLKDPRVSRKHCVVEVNEGTPRVIDSGSAGGILVNRQKVDTAILNAGDTLQVGETTLRFEVDSDPSTVLVEPSTESKPVAGDLSHLVGTTIHNYRIESEIARGVSGMVFRARHTKLNREMAVKVLWPDVCRDAEQMQRFIRAMKTMLPVQNENIVRIYNAGQTGPVYWVAMEYVDGESLTKVIERIGMAGMLTWEYAYRVATHIGRALEAAQAHQILHRNITPANILVRSSDKVAKLGDLVFAKALEGEHANQITRPGQLIGELAYMSPERTRGQQDIDHRSDIYGLGATVYALLTGRPPFVESSLVTLISRIRSEEPAKPSRFQMSIAPQFEGIVMRMLSKAPEDRYQAPEDLLRDLDRVGKFHGVKV